MLITYTPPSSGISSHYLAHHRSRQSSSRLAPSTDTITLKFSGNVELPDHIKTTIENACFPFYSLAVDEARKKSQETFATWVATQVEGKETAEAQRERADYYRAAREHAKDYCIQREYEPQKNVEVFIQPSTQKAKLSHRRSASREFAITSAERLLQDKTLSNDIGSITLALEGIERLMDQIEFDRKYRQRNPFSLSDKPPSQRWATVHSGLKEAIQTATQWKDQKKPVPNSTIQELKSLLKEGLDEVKPVHRSKSARSITNSINKTRESLSRAHSQEDLLTFENPSLAASDNEDDEEEEQALLRWRNFESDEMPYFPGQSKLPKSRSNLNLTGLPSSTDLLFPKLGSGQLTPLLPELQITSSPGPTKKRKTDRTGSFDSTESKKSTDELIAELVEKLSLLNPETDADEIQRTERLKKKLESYRGIQ